MRKLTDEDVAGRRFHRLTVTGVAPRSSVRVARVFVRCDCGTAKMVVWADLVRGNTKSCGCLMRQKSRERLDRHNAEKVAAARRANRDPDDRQIGPLARWLATTQWRRA